MRHGPQHQFLPAIVGFAPVLLMLVTWTPDGSVSQTILAVKWFAIPLLVVELFVIIVALRRGGMSAFCNARPRLSVVAAALGLLGIALVTAVLVAPNRAHALLFTSLWIFHALYGLAVLHLCDREFDRADLTTAWMAGYVIFAAGLMVFVTRVRTPAEFDWKGGLPAVANLRFLGFYAGAVIGLCIGRFAIVRGRWDFAATLLVAAVAYSIPLWSGSRGTFVATGSALAVGLVLFPTLRRRRVLLGLGASLLLASALVAWLPKPADPHWGPERIAQSVTSGDVTSDRDNLWRATIQAIAERPLFGHGEGQLPLVTPRLERHPHNSVLQVLVAWGMVGAACLLVLGLVFAGHVVGNVRANGGEWLPPCLALMVLVAYSAFDGTLFFPFPVSLAAAFAGLAAARHLSLRESPLT
jgi:O-antigen ligase